MDNLAEKMLAEDIASYYDDPLGFVYYAYPWGEEGTPLEHEDGPDAWQIIELEKIGKAIRERSFDGSKPVEPIRIAVSSGHGIGKSAFVSWITHFIMSTRIRCNGIITANTMAQLQTKTFKELSKWHDLLINKHWFDISTGGLKYWRVGDKTKWFAVGQTCREENSEAFAGQHNKTSTSFYIFDEASKIPGKIWETAEGGLTDGEPMIFVFGNPTQNKGKFKECFGKQSHRWDCTQVDSRTSRITNKKLIDEWIADYGEDSDFVRVRVKGEFPRSSSSQFIPSDIIAAARKKQIDERMLVGLTRTLACDVARFGDDETVISERWGNKATILDVQQGQDTMQTAAKVAAFMETGVYSDCMIDDTGVGGGVTDRVVQLGWPVTPVNNANTAMDAAKYHTIKAEMYDNFRTWLKHADIPDEAILGQELESIEYQFTGKQQIAIVPKSVMKRNGDKSPDRTDSLALHFAYPVAPASILRRPIHYRSEWSR